MKTYISIFFSLLIINILNAQKPISVEVTDVLSTVKPDSIKAHVTYLADDALKGRLPGTPGYEMAVKYVESQYQKLGLQAAGENNSYRQKVRIRTAKPDAERSSLIFNNGSSDITFESGKDYAFQGNFNGEEVIAEAPIAFAGYGISAPKLGYNDYANLNVKGKIVIVLNGVPSEKFGSTETAHLQRARTKIDIAYKQGAAGVLFLPGINVGSNAAGRFGSQNARGVRGVVLPDGKVDGGGVNPYESIRFVANLSWDGLKKLMGMTDKTTQEVAALLYNPKSPVVIKGTLKARVKSNFEDIESYNVVGKIPGIDKKLRNEYVIHTAHLDHVGIGTAVQGDSIYNGAHDNASGVASLLEIARLYTKLKKDKPKRSILFVMVTAEEMGLLGSYYFAKNPTVPKDKIVADVNTDMPTILAPLLGVVPLGAEHSSLMNNVKAAAEQLGLEVMQDHMPQEVRFVRSDQYSFVLQGIPALHIKYGLKTNDPNFDLDARIKDFTQNNYHKPSDELNDSFDFNAGCTYVKLNFLISHFTANDPKRPTWNKESIFAK